MKALVVNKGKLQLRQVKEPVARKGETIIQVKKAGICGTDLAIVSGDYKLSKPVVLGHEIFGATTQESKGIPQGCRVTTEINVCCGSCALCTAGLRNHCQNIETIGITRNGGFEEFVSVPVGNLHVIPRSVSDEAVVFIEPLAAAIQLTKMAQIHENSTCAVVGIGRLGLLILQVLKLSNPKSLVAITRHSGKDERSVLARSFGADEVYSSSKARTSIADFAQGIGFDHVVEATGSPDGIDTALGLVRPRGTIHVKSTHGLPVSLDLTKIAVKELRVQGSRCGPFDEAIRLMQEKKVSTEKLISRRFPLVDYVEAFRKAAAPQMIKVIFEF